MSQTQSLKCIGQILEKESFFFFENNNSMTFVVFYAIFQVYLVALIPGINQDTVTQLKYANFKHDLS